MVFGVGQFNYDSHIWLGYTLVAMSHLFIHSISLVLLLARYEHVQVMVQVLHILKLFNSRRIF